MWMISGTRVAARRGKQPVDELAIAGGMRGKAIEVVKSETNDMLVPAHSEMIIEGEVPLQEPLLPEGRQLPFMSLLQPGSTDRPPGGGSRPGPS